MLSDLTTNVATAYDAVMSERRHPLPFDVHTVTSLIERVGREIVMPRFRRLGDDDVEHKETAGFAEDLVTVVDRASERELTAGLRQIVETHVVGEEAAHDRAGIVECLQHDEPAWIVDPIDGTHNFVDGLDGFGIMVGFARQGRVEAGWIPLPARRVTFVAVAGGGVTLNGDPIRRDDIPDSYGRCRGSMFVRFMPDVLRARVRTAASGQYDEAPHAGAAAIEYTDILRGRKDFAVYYRLHPWDHGAPALILSEGGGCVEHLDRTPYSVRSPNQITIVAHTPQLAEEVRSWLADVDRI